jgi:hypothetical protein
MSATAALLTSLPGIDATKAYLVADFTVTLTGNYGTAASHGDTLDLSGLGVQSNEIPIVEFFETTPAGDAGSGLVFRYAPGTTQANGVLQIWDIATAAEVTEATAYSGVLPAAFALQGRAYYPLFI